MNALATRGTYQCVVMQSRDNRRAPCFRKLREVEREIEEIVYVDDIGLDRVKHLSDAFTDQRRTIGVNNRPADPVVDELYDWKAAVQPPRDISMRTRPVVLGAKHRDIMPPLELTTELEGIDLGPSLMTWEKIVDRVQNVETARMHEGFLGVRSTMTHLAHVVLPPNH